MYRDSITFRICVVLATTLFFIVPNVNAQKISDLSPFTGTLDKNDVAPIVDVSDAGMGPSGTTKKVTVSKWHEYEGAAYPRTEADLIADVANSNTPVIVLATDVTLSAPLVIPAGKTFTTLPGAEVTTSAANTLTVDSIEGNPMHQLFVGGYAGVSNGPVNPLWYTSGLDMADGIQKAYDNQVALFGVSDLITILVPPRSEETDEYEWGSVVDISHDSTCVVKCNGVARVKATAAIARFFDLGMDRKHSFSEVSGFSFVSGIYAITEGVRVTSARGAWIHRLNFSVAGGGSFQYGVTLDGSAHTGGDGASGFVGSVIENIQAGGDGSILEAVVYTTGMTNVVIRNIVPQYSSVGPNYGVKGIASYSAISQSHIYDIQTATKETAIYIDSGGQGCVRNVLEPMSGSGNRGVQIVQPIPTQTSTTISFADTNPDTILDSASGFVASGFMSGMTLTVSGSGSNNGTYSISSVTAGTITLAVANTLVAEAAGATVVLTGTPSVADNVVNVRAGSWSTAGIVIPNASTTVQRNILNGTSVNLGDPNSAGSWQTEVEGISVYDTTNNRHYVYHEAAWKLLPGTEYAYAWIDIERNCLDGSSAPGAAATLTSSSRVARYRDFSGVATNDVECMWEVPPDLSGTTVSFRPITWVTNATGPSNEGLAFGLSGVSVGNGETLGGALGTEVVKDRSAITVAQYRMLWTFFSDPVTFTGLAASESVKMRFRRIHDHASDTYAQPLGVSGFWIKYLRAVQ